MTNWRALRTLIAVGAILALPGIAFAQEAFIAGTITDTTGAVLPGVTITATHIDTGNTFTGVTDEKGVYRIPVRIGVFRIVAELAGFTTIDRSGLEVQVGQTVGLNLQMAITGLAETLTVTAQAPLVNTTNSTMASNVDSRQMQDLPLNGRNFLDLASLAQGARQNSVDPGGAPQVGTSNGTFQINIDGQQVTNNCCGNTHQASFSRDAIAEFQFIANRFDATQGRSSGIQVNVITKSGTNTPAGSTSGYFRSDKFNSADFIAGRVLPYSDQQFSGTYGGPIVENKIHYFGSYEFERQPSTNTFNSAYTFANVDLPSTEIQNKAAVRVDSQLSGKTSFSIYGNLWRDNQPVSASLINSATSNPSQGVQFLQYSNNVQGKLSQVLTSKTLNQVTFGWANTYWNELPDTLWAGNTGLALARKSLSILEPGVSASSLDARGENTYAIAAPNVALPGYTLGPATNYPQLIGQDIWTLRNDLTSSYTLGGRHDVKVGGEYLKYTTWHYWCNFLNGALTANKGSALSPALMQSLFPNYADPSTWNLNGIPTSALNNYQASLGNCNIDSPRNILAGWYQDDWQVKEHLTVNLGLRYDVETDPFANELQVPTVPGALGEVFLKANRPNDYNDWSPRLGFAWSLNDKTVIRGGGGIYYSEVSNQAAHPVRFATVQVVPSVPYLGQANFATNPFGGPLPSFETIQPTFCNNDPGLNFSLALTGVCNRRAVGQTLVDPNAKFPKSYQATLGFQRQLGETESVTSDFSYTGLRGDRITGYNMNLGFNPATGMPYNFNTNFAARPYPDWAAVPMDIWQGTSDSYSLNTAWTKRMSNHWQASATYTLSWFYTGVPAAYSGVVGTPFGTGGPVPFALAAPFNSQYTLASGDQRHRAVVNAIWDIGHGFQLSGLFFYGSGARTASTWGGDNAVTGATVNAAQVCPAANTPGCISTGNGTASYFPINSFVGQPLYRVDTRLQKRLHIAGRLNVDGTFEVFNLFNHANYGSYVTANNGTTPFGTPQSNLNVAYQPRMMQLGFRIVF